MPPASRIPSPLHWFGGKSHLATKIVEFFPPHGVYCEPFGGSAAVLLAKEPSHLEVYNDINREAVDFFRVVRDPKLMAKLHRALQLTPHSRSEFQSAKKPSPDPVESARRFMLCSRQSYMGKRKEWKYSTPRLSTVISPSRIVGSVPNTWGKLWNLRDRAATQLTTFAVPTALRLAAPTENTSSSARKKSSRASELSKALTAQAEMSSSALQFFRGGGIPDPERSTRPG